MNPKPLPAPVLLSLTIRTASMSPQSTNVCLNGSSSVSEEIESHDIFLPHVMVNDVIFYTGHKTSPELKSSKRTLFDQPRITPLNRFQIFFCNCFPSLVEMTVRFANNENNNSYYLLRQHIANFIRINDLPNGKFPTNIDLE